MDVFFVEALLTAKHHARDLYDVAVFDVYFKVFAQAFAAVPVLTLKPEEFFNRVVQVADLARAHKLNRLTDLG